MTIQRRRKASGEVVTDAARAAAALVPDPSMGVEPEAPPHEEHDDSSTRVDAQDYSDGESGPDPKRGPWGVVIDAVLQVDPENLFRKLRAELSLDGEAMTYQTVHLALDQADRRYFEASLLSRAAKLEEQRVEREIEESLEVLRTSARAEVEAEKRKAIDEAKSKGVGRATKEEVQDRLIASWPDKVRSLERRRDEHHAARAVAEELATSWRSRAASLRELVQGLRSRA